MPLQAVGYYQWIQYLGRARTEVSLSAINCTLIIDSYLCLIFLMLYDVFAMCREQLRYRPLLKGTDRHEQGTTRVDGKRISTTQLIFKTVTLFSTLFISEDWLLADDMIALQALQDATSAMVRHCTLCSRCKSARHIEPE